MVRYYYYGYSSLYYLFVYVKSEKMIINEFDSSGYPLECSFLKALLFIASL